LANESEVRRVSEATRASREFIRAAQTVSQFAAASDEVARIDTTLTARTNAYRAFVETLTRMNRSLLDLGKLETSIKMLETLSPHAQGADRTIVALIGRTDVADLRLTLEKLREAYRSPAELADVLNTFRSTAVRSADLRNALIHAAEVDYAVAGSISEPSEVDSGAVK
jgi:hypothetical protein